MLFKYRTNRCGTFYHSPTTTKPGNKLLLWICYSYINNHGARSHNQISDPI